VFPGNSQKWFQQDKEVVYYENIVQGILSANSGSNKSTLSCLDKFRADFGLPEHSGSEGSFFANCRPLQNVQSNGRRRWSVQSKLQLYILKALKV
jgi:hypothetical protein